MADDQENSGSSAPRQPRNMQGLLRLAIENTSQSESQPSSRESRTLVLDEEVGIRANLCLPSQLINE